MKELSVEEKAKRYDEALERARKCLDEKRDTCFVRPDVIFPELKESEDERIRKTIIRFFKDNYPNETEMYDGSVTVGKAIVWLEKQDKKSPFNKERLMEVAKPETVEEQIEHWQRMRHIAEKRVKELLENQDEQKNKITFEDVLALECAMKTARITKGGNELYEMLVSLHNKIYNAYLDEKQGGQKSAWSEEDEHRLEDTIYFLDTAKKHYACTDELDACIDWLKSIKQRMEEQ